MQLNSPQFLFFDRDTLNKHLRIRTGETKLGECISLPEMQNLGMLQTSPATFVLIGVPEDIGVQANLGLAGTAGGWNAFLNAFLNIQENRFLSGREFLLMGALQLPEAWPIPIPESNLDQGTKEEKLSMLRAQTKEIDLVLSPIVRAVFDSGKIPIIIGGGHNNAFPIIEAGAQSLQTGLNILNIDPHADYRALEGRHSGNGFRYARERGYLKKYAMLGLHENYNAENILSEIIGQVDFLPVFWEEIFLRKHRSPEAALDTCLKHIGAQEFGVELDLDSIENVLSSAATPVGLPPVLCMHWLYTLGKHPNSFYLHLPEGTLIREDGMRSPLTGKLLTYLVQGFCKGVLER